MSTEIRPDASSHGVFQVSGELVIETVPALLASGRTLLGAGGGDIVVDLRGVTRADSAGLALLVEWLRAARRERRDLAFRNMPDKMIAMADVSGLNGVLPIADGTGPENRTDRTDSDNHA